jgi:peptidoglycan/LPS O-acetylase OafA/YrhL
LTPPGGRGVETERRAGRFVALDSLRGLAAVGVLFSHIGPIGLIGTLPLVRDSSGLFVDFFFVRSGFVIAAAYSARIAGGFSRGTFMLLRFGRTYPLHVAVIAAFVLVKLASGRSLLEGEHGIDYLLRATFYLEGFFHDSNFYNGPSWSIAVEFVAYALAALLFGRGLAGTIAAMGIWFAALVAYANGFEWLVFTVYLQRCLIGFGLGCLAWWIHSRFARPAASAPASVAEAGALFACVAAIVSIGPAGWRLLACDVVFVAVVLVFAQDRGRASALLAMAPFQALGRWSYSINMTQMLVITVGTQFLLLLLPWFGRGDLVLPVGEAGFGRIDFGVFGGTVLSVVVAAICIALAAVTFRLIEQPGRDWARRMAKERGAGGAEAVAPTI